MDKSDMIASFIEIGKLLTSTLNLEEILERIIQKVSQLADAQNWSLLLKDKETGKLTFEVVVGIKKEILKGVRLAAGEGIASHVASTGTPVILSNVKNDPRFNGNVDLITGFTTTSIICIPLQIYGKVLGVIEILNVEDIENFRLRHLSTLMILADYAAIAIENSRNFAKIQEMSMTDELTGLYNRRGFITLANQQLKIANRLKRGVLILYADIDNMKYINDTFGHREGDMALVETGYILKEVFRQSDIIARIGGDEFVVFPIEIIDTSIEALSARFQEYINTCNVNRKRDYQLTISTGIVYHEYECPYTIEELISQADKAMYNQKKHKHGS